MDDIDGGRVHGWIEQLCSFPDRHVGGQGNRAAAELFADVASGAGLDVATVELPCVEWRRGASLLRVGGEDRVVQSGPYSLPYAGMARLSAAGTIEELEGGGLSGSVLLLHGDLVREQLMPKEYPFYNPDRHRRIVAALERSGARAMIAATGRNPEMAGGSYPFPLLEDGDFDLPWAYVTDVEGRDLLGHLGEEVELVIDSGRAPATALQPLARRAGRGEGRLVFFAHLDSKDGTPGALDNASGVATMLALAVLLGRRGGERTVELVPLNGEDYYGATGQLWWLRENEGRLGDIVLGLNVDGAGFRGERTAVSLYAPPEETAAIVREAAEARGFVEGPQWPQGDHSLFAMHGVPAVAVTSENAFFIATTVAHTERDVPDLVDAAAVAEVARFFADVAAGLNA